MINLDLKTVVISGGLGLLGKEFAKTLSREYNVILLDTRDKVDGHYAGQEEYYFYAFSCDITNESNIKQTIEYINEKWHHIDILVNCAAINPSQNIGDGIFNDFETYPLELWNKTMNTNLTGAFLLSRECIKYMLKNKNEGFKGTTINIASDLGIIASDNRIYNSSYKKPVDYGVSKAGLIYLTKYIAGYYRDEIKSVCLVPGSVYTNQSEDLKENLENRIPINRLANKNEYNGAIKFLCSQDSDYMQGSNLIMCGGRTIW